MRSWTVLGLVAALGSSCKHPRGGETSATTEPSSPATQPVPSLPFPDHTADAQADLEPTDASPSDAGLGCEYVTRGHPGRGNRWLTSFVINAPWYYRSFSVDVDRTAFYNATTEERPTGIRLPEKDECTRQLPQADIESFERAVRDAGVCGSPLYSTTPDPAATGPSVHDPRYQRWYQGHWALLLCTEFGEQCSIQRRADEWTHDPKLRPLLKAMEAITRATCSK